MTATYYYDGRRSIRLDQLPEDAWQALTTVGATGSDAVKLFGFVAWSKRCLDLRANALAGMPFDVLQRKSSGALGEVIGSDAAPPAGFEMIGDLPAILARVEASLCLHGAAYVRKWRAGKNGPVRALSYYAPSTITEKYGAGTVDDLRFMRKVKSDTATTLKADDVLYFWLPDHTVELGPAKYTPALAAGRSIALLDAFQQVSSDWIERGMIAPTILTFDQRGRHDETARRQFRDWWRRVFRGTKNSFATEVVDADVKAVKIGDSLADVSDLALTATERENIATAFGVPHSKVSPKPGGLGDVTSGDDLVFLSDTIIPDANVIEAALNRQLFWSLGIHFRFVPARLEPFQQAELAKSQALKELAGRPVITVNEARAKLELEPVAGGDTIADAAGVESLVMAEAARIRRFVLNGSHRRRAFESNVISPQGVSILTEYFDELTDNAGTNGTAPDTRRAVEPTVDDADIARMLRRFEDWAKDNAPDIAQLLRAEVVDTVEDADALAE